MKRVVVVGGGIAGLSLALHLKDRSSEVAGGLEVRVLEARDRVGGNIQTHQMEGFTIEGGPNGFLDNVPATLTLVNRLELQDRLQQADARATKRYLYRHGRLHLLPSNPLSFLKSPILSWRGRLRVLREPFARPKTEATDETILSFGQRRIGPEATSILIDAMVSGVFAGNIHHLSLPSTFPKMAEMEAAHGSLVRAMLAKKKAAREQRALESGSPPAGGPAGPRGTLTSFKTGLDTLPHAMETALGDSVSLNQRVSAIKPTGQTDPTAPWHITTQDLSLDADAVILATPAPQTARLLGPLDTKLETTLNQIPSAGLAVVALAFNADDIGGSPDGFGFLAPRSESLRLLGCLWDSSIFPSRAPDGKVLLRVMIGGAHDPEAVSMDEEILIQTVRQELATAMNLTAAPVFTRVFRYPLGIAQYTVGHQQRLNLIQAHLDALPGIWVAGSSYYGVSMNACIEKAETQANAVLDYLKGC